MFRFIRTTTVRTAADLPAAIGFATEVTAHVNQRYGIGMKWGVESYGESRIHWHFDIDSLDKMQQLNLQLLEDRPYLELLTKFKETWVPGSMRDQLVVFKG